MPRVPHPDWLLKRLAEKNSTCRQRKIEDMFSFRPRQTVSAELTQEVADIEDLSSIPKPTLPSSMSIQKSNPNATKRKLGDDGSKKQPKCNFKETLGSPPRLLAGKAEFLEWLGYHKQKWKLQIEFRNYLRRNEGAAEGARVSVQAPSLTSFVMKAATTKAQRPWQILRVSETSQVGVYKLWMLAEAEMFSIELKMQRTFYVNQIKPLEKESSLCRKANKHLPRSQVSYNLYEYQLPESAFQKHHSEIMAEFSTSNVEGNVIQLK